MSGRPHGPRPAPQGPGPRLEPRAPGPRAEAPLLPPTRAARLLEDVIFARVAELIDLPQIFDLEAMLALQIESLGVDTDAARATARELVDRALARVAQTSRQWTHRSPPADGACELCGDLCGPAEEDTAP